MDVHRLSGPCKPEYQTARSIIVFRVVLYTGGREAPSVKVARPRSCWRKCAPNFVRSSARRPGPRNISPCGSSTSKANAASRSLRTAPGAASRFSAHHSAALSICRQRQAGAVPDWRTGVCAPPEWVRCCATDNDLDRHPSREDGESALPALHPRSTQARFQACAFCAGSAPIRTSWPG